MTEKEARQLNPLVMAFVGDSVFTLFVRQKLASVSHCKAGGLHKQANKFVSATAQSYIFERLESMLTEDEASIARRAKNAHNNTVAKHATVADYKRATSLEAILGYLSLSGQTDRLETLLGAAYEINVNAESERNETQEASQETTATEKINQ